VLTRSVAKSVTVFLGRKRSLIVQARKAVLQSLSGNAGDDDDATHDYTAQ